MLKSRFSTLATTVAGILLATAAALIPGAARASNVTLTDDKLAIDTLQFALEPQLALGSVSVKGQALVLQAKKGKAPGTTRVPPAAL